MSPRLVPCDSGTLRPREHATTGTSFPRQRAAGQRSGGNEGKQPTHGAFQAQPLVASFRLSATQFGPEVPNWTQHRIPNANQHPISMMME